MFKGYPHEEAAIVALKTIRDFLEHDHNLVIFKKFYINILNIYIIKITEKIIINNLVSNSYFLSE